MTRTRGPLPFLVRAGHCQLFIDRCPGQKRPATAKNGDNGRTFWLPGLSINVRWGDL